jgi:hypothetical protein
MDNAISCPSALITDDDPIRWAADPFPRGAVRVALYIDADNQSSQSAGALVDLLHNGLGTHIVRATIAGNSDGKVTAGWSAALRKHIPDLPIKAIVVPCRKDAADAALILAMGADLAEHLRLGVRVVVVSRDALLLAAAAQAKSDGCRIYVAYADCEMPTARSPALTTLLLPVLSSAGVSVEHPPVVALAPKAPSTNVSPQPTSDVAKVIAQVRSLCKQQPGGGYSATDVGQALSKIGYKTPAERKGVIATFPGIREKGAHPNKLLLF